MEEGKPIRVLIADDHPVVRRGLVALCAGRGDIEVAAEAGTADEALSLAEETRPNVLVLDLHMPGRPVMELLPELRERLPEVAVLVLTMDEDPALAEQALRLGAAGYAFKRAAADEFVEAIHAVAEGRGYSNAETRALISRHQAAAERQLLTERELEVLRLLALGHTQAEVAERLGISVRTVESHRLHIVQKANLQSRPDLVRYALDQGLI